MTTSIVGKGAAHSSAGWDGAEGNDKAGPSTSLGMTGVFARDEDTSLNESFTEGRYLSRRAAAYEIKVKRFAIRDSHQAPGNRGHGGDAAGTD
jgi:hypothetical protein